MAGEAVAPLVAGGSIQTVHGGSTGNQKVQSVSLQMVSTSIAGQLRAGFSDLQIVSSSIAGFLKAGVSDLQIVQGGSTGDGKFASSSMQPVYRIGIQDVPRKLAWTYTLDGHYFYCLDLGADGTHVYDVTTKQWAKFDTIGYSGHFNFKNGILWKTGKRIIGGDVLTGAVYEMDPESYFDDGWRPALYEARGALFAQGISKRKNYALRLIGSSGRTGDDIAPVLNMRFSDDQGETWSIEYPITLTTDSKQRLEWRSLGAFDAPGRIFRFYDTGGIKWIGWAEADIE